MKKIDSIKLYLTEFFNSWNFLIGIVWFFIYAIIFSSVAIITHTVRVIELYIPREPLLVIFLSIISVIIIHDAISYNTDQNDD
jgi:hypothetical protein